MHTSRTVSYYELLSVHHKTNYLKKEYNLNDR